MKKFLVLTVALLLSGSVLAAQGTKGADVLVSVNNSKITRAYIDNALQREAALLPEEQRTQENLQNLANNIISRRIDELVVLDAAKKAKVTVSAKEVKDAVDANKKNFKTEADFNNALKQQGTTRAKYESDIKDNLIRVKYISNEVKKRTELPADEEIETFYNYVVAKVKNKPVKADAKTDELATSAANRLKRIYGEQVKVRQIFVKYSDNLTKEQKKEVNDKIKELKKELSAKDVNFSQLSEKYSDDEVLRQTRGDIGYVLKEDLTPEVSKVIFGLKIGEYNKSPIKTGNGYHFFRVEEMKADMPIEYNAVKQFLADTLYRQSIQDEYGVLMDELRASANIKFN